MLTFGLPPHIVLKWVAFRTAMSPVNVSFQKSEKEKPRGRYKSGYFSGISTCGPVNE